MPKGVKSPSPFSPPPPSNGASRSGTGTPIGSTSSFFPQYEVEDDIPRTGTPPPIKVTRTKKKKKGTGVGTKKSRVAEDEHA